MLCTNYKLLLSVLDSRASLFCYSLSLQNTYKIPLGKMLCTKYKLLHLVLDSRASLFCERVSLQS